MLRIRRPVDVLWLVVVLICYILLNLLLLFLPPRLEGLVLRMDLVEPLGAFTWRVIKLTALNSIIETYA
jgi:hypothetical protein